MTTDSVDDAAGKASENIEEVQNNILLSICNKFDGSVLQFDRDPRKPKRKIMESRKPKQKKWLEALSLGKPIGIIWNLENLRHTWPLWFSHLLLRNWHSLLRITFCQCGMLKNWQLLTLCKNFTYSQDVRRRKSLEIWSRIVNYDWNKLVWKWNRFQGSKKNRRRVASKKWWWVLGRRSLPLHIHWNRNGHLFLDESESFVVLSVLHEN